jgi:hypothetical protein
MDSATPELRFGVAQYGELGAAACRRSAARPVLTMEVLDAPDPY